MLDWRLCRTGGWLIVDTLSGSDAFSGRTERLDAACFVKFEMERDSATLGEGLSSEIMLAFGWAFISLLLEADGTVTTPASTATFVGGGYSAVSVAFFSFVSVSTDCGFDLAEEELVAADPLTWEPEPPPPPALRTVTFVFSSNETGKPSELAIDSFVLFSISS